MSQKVNLCKTELRPELASVRHSNPWDWCYYREDFATWVSGLCTNYETVFIPPYTYGVDCSTMHNNVGFVNEHTVRKGIH